MSAAVMRRSASLLALAATLGGCASFSPDGGFAPVEQAARSRLGKDLHWSRSDADQAHIQQRVDTLLAQPLTADNAVQVALLNNRGLQASLQNLGVADAERVQAGRLPNPGFSFGRLRRGDELELERGLHLNLASLLALPQTQALAAQRLVQTQGQLVIQVFTLAADTRKAYIQALAAEQMLHYQRQVQQAAAASADLARRMAQVGNFNALQRSREQVFLAEANLGQARAEQARRATRERLIRLLGLWGEQTVKLSLPERLPDLPPDALELPDIEPLALAQRLDVQGAKQAAAQTAASLGLVRRTRFVNVLDLGLLDKRADPAPPQRGWEISVELPLFDWGDARVAGAEARYLQALHQAAETAINARSEVREAYGAYRTAYDMARYQRDEGVPLAQRIADENLLRYNGMLIGVFELLADARSQIASVQAAIGALRDFWLAQADLDLALIGPPRLGSGAAPAAGNAAAADARSGGH